MRRTALVAGALVTVLVTIWVYRGAGDRSAVAARERLSEIARLDAERIDGDLRRWADLLGSLSALDVDRLDEARFAEFVDRALTDRDQAGVPTGTFRGMGSVVWVSAPAVDDAAADAPSADAPSADAPSADAPSADAPSADAPSADAPSADSPSADDAAAPYLVTFARPESLAADVVGADLRELPDRVEGLERARDSGRPAIVGFFVPLTEAGLPDEQQTQLGSLYVPIYRGGSAPATIAERRASLVGWAITGFRASDLLEPRAVNSRLALTLTVDGVEVYSTAPVGDRALGSAEVNAFGERWQLTVADTDPSLDVTGLDDPRVAALLIALLGPLAMFAIDVLLRARAAGLGRLRLVENRAEASDRAWRRLAEEVSAGLFVVEPSGVIGYANRTAGVMLGLDEVDLVGRPLDAVFDVCCSDETPGHGVAQQVLSGQSSVHAELRTGDRLHLAATSGPDGGRLITIEDITAERKAIDELATALRVSAQQRERNRRVIATMSHEIRTPLAGIVGLSRLALDDLPPEAESGTVLQQVHDIGSDLLELVNDALSVSVSESGALRVSSGPVRIESLLRSLRASLDGDLNAGVDLVVRVEGVDVVEVDSSRLRQLIGNLMANAIRHTTRGVVTVEVDRTAAGLLRVVVADTGPGILPADQDQVFEPFFQSGRNNQRPGGAGLGLTVVKSVVTAMGGTIALVSEVGVGSRFTLELPAPDVEAPEADGLYDEAPSGRPAEGMTAVVVDDDAISGEVAARQLTRLGAQVTVIDDGPEALRRIGRLNASILVADLHMPEVEGFAIIEAALDARRATGRPHLIVAATASTAADDHERCRIIGADAVLLKPIDRNALVELIERHRPGDVELPPSVLEMRGGDLELADDALHELAELGVLENVVAMARDQIPVLANTMRSPDNEKGGAHRSLAAHTLAGTLRSLGAHALVGQIEALRSDLESEPDAAMHLRIAGLATSAEQVLAAVSERFDLTDRESTFVPASD